MNKLPSRAIITLIVLATVASVYCTFDPSTKISPDIEFGGNYGGCYEEGNEQFYVVLNLVPEGYGLLRGCLIFRVNQQDFEGFFPITGEVVNDTTTENMKATVTPADIIEFELTRNVTGPIDDQVVSISIDFPGESPMENIPRKSVADEENICRLQCP